jgi:8-oxo-dGTP pyrophosphatase MutT (NUDIX family)
MDLPIMQRKQYAALPLRFHDGEPQVMLVTSRGTQRWILPKGNPERRLSPAKLAAKEAFEEAGVAGVVYDQPVGHYRAPKHLDNGQAVALDIEVYRLDVQQQFDVWQERGQRERRWFSLPEAARVVSDAALTTLLLEIDALLIAGTRDLPLPPAVETKPVTVKAKAGPRRKASAKAGQGKQARQGKQVRKKKPG